MSAPAEREQEATARELLVEMVRFIDQHHEPGYFLRRHPCHFEVGVDPCSEYRTLFDAALASREAEVRRPVLLEIHEERIRQHAKWGEQSHPDGTGPSLILCDLPAYQNAVRADHLALWAGQRCKNAPNDGGDTYERILTEEWAEAIAESDPQALRAELVQVAAVAVQWIESIDRRSQL